MSVASAKGMRMLDNGKIRNHKLSITSRTHGGEEEKNEARNFRDFLRTKNGCHIMRMKGHA